MFHLIAYTVGIRSDSSAPLGGGAESAPPVFFSRITPKQLQISTYVSTLPYIDWTSNDQIWLKSVGTFFLEIDVFVGSLHANFEQNRLNVKKFAKNRALTLARTCYFPILERTWGGCTPHAISSLIEIEQWD